MKVLLRLIFGLLFFGSFATETLASVKLQGLRSLFPTDVLSVEKEDDFLVSPNGTFTAGFYKVGTNAYCFSIWFTNSADRTVTWMANRDKPDIHACSVRGLCGKNGICVYAPKPSCACPPRFKRTDPSDWSKGCSPEFKPTCNDSEFVQLFHTDYYGYDLVNTGLGKTFRSCKNACLVDCNCKGFAYQYTGQGNCYLKSILFNGYQMPDYPNVMYIRVPRQNTTNARANMTLNVSAMNCSERNVVIIEQPAENNDKHSNLKYLIGFVVSIGIVELICMSLGWWFIKRIHGIREVVDMGYVALAVGFKNFTYDELKKATKNFREEIGKGSFGAVFKGVLDDGRVVAVKRLERISQGEAEFWAEVSIIGRINHMNLVRMWGFCAEDEHRILVYEYLENGSLDKFLFSNSSECLAWAKRFDIALGTAKGLSYLHEECLEWILHCDIKPQNILLDDQLQPKVADFGLSKLAVKKGLYSNFSKVRGTRGYLAPEWILNQEITSKADVYSYGIVLLELLSGRSASGDQDPLVQWIEEKLKQDEAIEGVADPKLNGVYNHKQLKKLIEVALLCVRGDKKERPDMSGVVSILLRDD